ncbi:MAG: putative porin [Verrucomicrobia bacterium]|nr:putative porin [Verrucomicrobiota bacterium]
MKKQTFFSAALALVVIASGVQAQDSSALLDALVRKKVLTSQEAEDVRADLVRDNASANSNKIQLSNSITSLKLYGDIRLRYQYDNKDPQIETPRSANPTALTGVGAPQHGTQRSFERIRLRLNGDFTLAGGFFGGVQLQTSQSADGANQTLGDSGSGAAGFGNYNIYISRAYFGWANDWLTLIGGKQPNPFYTTDLVWDPDFNPDGAVEKIDLIALFNGGTSEAVTYSKDGKAVSSVATVPANGRYALSLVAGQFIYGDNPEDAFGADYKTDAWIFQTQLIGSAKLTPNIKLTVAPGFMGYTSGNTSSLNNSVPFAGGVNGYRYSVNEKNGPLVVHSANRDLAIITAPGDLSFKLWGLKTKLLWDFAYNTQGTSRVKDIFGLRGIQIPIKNSQGVVTGYKNTHGPVTDSTLVNATRVSGHSSEDDIAWLAGIQVGENKKAGDWSVIANFRRTGIGAVDPNLNDSDFALSYLNMQGIKTGLAYNFTDFFVGAITYYDAWNLRNDLVGGEATGGQKIANMNAVQVFQLDLNLKF